MRIGPELVNFVEQCYQTAVTDPVGTRLAIQAELQQHQAALTANAADYAVGGLQFLDLCLSPEILRFEMPCECLSLPQPHCYYDHLYVYFYKFVVAVYQHDDNSYSQLLMRYEDGINQGASSFHGGYPLYLLLYYLGTCTELLALSSMAVTLRPFFNVANMLRSIRGETPYNFNQFYPKLVSRAKTKKQNIYIRLAMDFLPDERGITSFPVHIVNCPPYETTGFDFRGSQFEGTSFCDQFTWVNLNNTVWHRVRLSDAVFINCQLNNIRHNNCQFERIIYTNSGAGFAHPTLGLQSPLSPIMYQDSCYFPRPALPNPAPQPPKSSCAIL